MTTTCSLGEMMIAALARTIEDGSLVFHGFGSPLVQLAMHVAKRTHAPRMVLVAGATYGVDPDPPFLAPTTNDWAMDRGASSALDIEELFDLAAAGRMGRMFLSGLQIDKWGNCNVTALGYPDIAMKLPGGGGGGNLSCDAKPCHPLDCPPIARRKTQRVGGASVSWRRATSSPISATAAVMDGRARDYGHRGNGPQWLVTELGLFDFDADGHARLQSGLSRHFRGRSPGEHRVRRHGSPTRSKPSPRPSVRSSS